MTASLQDAIAAVRAGETERAQLLAAEVIRDNPDDANAWYLLSQLVDSDARRAVYLHKALALEPEHSRARAEFDALPATAVASLWGTDVPQPVATEAMATEAVATEVVTTEAVATEVFAPAVEVFEESAAAEAEAQPEAPPEWLRPLSPEPVPTTATTATPTPVVEAPPASAPARPRQTPPPPPPRRQNNGALTALLVILLLLTLAVLAVLAYLLVL